MRVRSFHRSFGGAGPHITKFGRRKTLLPYHGLCSSIGERSPVKGLVAGASPVRDPMSYGSKKLRKNKFNQLKYRLKKIEIVLLKNIKKLTGREKAMRLRGVRNVMEFLRKRNKIIRPNNLKISEWVDNYLTYCLMNGKAVNILTQWCISKDLEERFKKQGGKFVPTKKERKLFETELPQIISVFSNNGFKMNWWITFNRSYLDSGRINKELEDKYKKIITNLAENSSIIDNVVFLDWEEEVLNSRPAPNRDVLDNFQRYIPEGAYNVELERHSKWAREEAGLNQTNNELEKDVKFQIACEVQEGFLLTSKDSPFEKGNFILIPLEMPERYDFFEILTRDFKRRIVSVIPCYPWRL